jgi:hypothetical protein
MHKTTKAKTAAPVQLRKDPERTKIFMKYSWLGHYWNNDIVRSYDAKTIAPVEYGFTLWFNHLTSKGVETVKLATEKSLIDGRVGVHSTIKARLQVEPFEDSWKLVVTMAEAKTLESARLIGADMLRFKRALDINFSEIKRKRPNFGKGPKLRVTRTLSGYNPLYRLHDGPIHLGHVHGR